MWHSVSIHALLAECDHHPVGCLPPVQGFNPRTPCGVRPETWPSNIRYQSVSIHALLAECDSNRKEGINNETVSIHALLAECDAASSRPGCYYGVSIHALLAECDLISTLHFTFPRCFNPRTPCGVRPRLRPLPKRKRRFQSTHSLRSATVVGRNADARQVVSIHALLAECDHIYGPVTQDQTGFNPRTPCGVRRCCTSKKQKFMKFQSTHSLRSATGHCDICETYKKVSIHALLAECDGSASRAGNSV